VGLEVTTGGIRTGIGTERWRERVANFRAATLKQRMPNDARTNGADRMQLCEGSLRGPPGALDPGRLLASMALLRMAPAHGTDYQRASDHQNCRYLRSSASSRPTCLFQH